MHKLPLKMTPAALTFSIQLTNLIKSCEDTEDENCTKTALQLFKQTQGIIMDPFNYTLALNLCVKQTGLFGCCVLTKVLDHKEMLNPIAFEGITQTVTTTLTQTLKTKQNRTWTTKEFTRHFLHIADEKLKKLTPPENAAGMDKEIVERINATLSKLNRKINPPNSSKTNPSKIISI